MLHRIVSSRWFALADLFLVVLSGCFWMLTPEIGILPVIAIALIPWAVRLSAGLFPFKRTSLDWLVVLFLATAWVGYWAAYDRETAWSKIWLISLAVLLYYALAGQPLENLEWVCIFLFSIGAGVSTYFFLTHDFIAIPRKLEIVNRIGLLVMKIRPSLGWTPIHPNYVAGIVAITTPFVLYPVRKWMKILNDIPVLYIPVLLGLGVAGFAIFMTTSRGIILAMVGAFGVWIGWRIVGLNGNRRWLRREAIYPALLLIYLCAVVLFLYAGPANSGGRISTDYPYGTGSRAELFARSIDLVLDFPFTGGGLTAFPGLYSYYMLGIPFFNVPNSHNLFLDVAIEQGLAGGLSFLVVFLMSIWFMAQAIVKTDALQARPLHWLTLFVLVIAFVHGMVDDYLYNGSGTFLSLALAGVSTSLYPEPVRAASHKKRYLTTIVALTLIIFFMINLNGVRSAWSANLGAVQMAKVELAGFPTNQWTEPVILPELEQASASLRTALQADPANRTANHRLGLISMLQEDFPSAATYLENARQQAPNHRGIVKSLGYCYAWAGDTEKAVLFLSRIPEAKDELDSYIWWWGIQGRPDLAEKAHVIFSGLERFSAHQ